MDEGPEDFDAFHKFFQRATLFDQLLSEPAVLFTSIFLLGSRTV